MKATESTTKFAAGDQIEWTYRHTLNSRQSTLITKTGVVLRNAKRTKIYKPQMVVVKFDRNKNPSTIPEGELKRKND